MVVLVGGRFLMSEVPLYRGGLVLRLVDLWMTHLQAESKNKKKYPPASN
eukprot:CAMPEP_0180145458 /NCGR_PEP_ID=MMETSP0986-20121125/17687_1 /TAXON_ID=697907 /ORGANISM="non described non described, Strain CCMP2293" /LENGTH=48 /DNA_ID= /DNA_START= /DNA_END= /DNA_ORIENTATION=